MRSIDITIFNCFIFTSCKNTQSSKYNNRIVVVIVMLKRNRSSFCIDTNVTKATAVSLYIFLPVSEALVIRIGSLV